MASLNDQGLLGEEAIEAFVRDGFIAIEELIDDREVERLRNAYDGILEAGNTVSTNRLLGGITRQVMVPSMHSSVFEHNEAIVAARRVVGQFYNTPTAARTYDMLIDKPAGHPHTTPWHQDAGYYARPVAPAGSAITFRAVQVWLALDDVDVENGGMQFVPGRHYEPLLPHRVAAGDPDDEGRLIEIVDPIEVLPILDAVTHPLRAGGCTMHLPGTPHFTGPNLSERSRRAYIFNLQPGDASVTFIESRMRTLYVDNIATTRAHQAGLAGESDAQ